MVPCHGMYWGGRQPGDGTGTYGLASSTSGCWEVWGPPVVSLVEPFPGQLRLDSIRSGSWEREGLASAKVNLGEKPWSQHELSHLPRLAGLRGLPGANVLGIRSVAWPVGQETWTTAVNWQWVGRFFNCHLPPLGILIMPLGRHHIISPGQIVSELLDSTPEKVGLGFEEYLKKMFFVKCCTRALLWDPGASTQPGVRACGEHGCWREVVPLGVPPSPLLAKIVFPVCFLLMLWNPLSLPWHVGGRRGSACRPSTGCGVSSVGCSILRGSKLTNESSLWGIDFWMN